MIKPARRKFITIFTILSIFSIIFLILYFNNPDFRLNLLTEIIGIIITVGVVDRYLSYYNEQISEEKIKPVRIKFYMDFFMIIFSREIDLKNLKEALLEHIKTQSPETIEKVMLIIKALKEGEKELTMLVNILSEIIPIKIKSEITLYITTSDELSNLNNINEFTRSEVENYIEKIDEMLEWFNDDLKEFIESSIVSEKFIKSIKDLAIRSYRLSYH